MSGPRDSIADSRLATRLRKELEGEVLFDAFSRGRYSTDASIYQVTPLGVVVPRTSADVARTLQIASEEGVPVVPRGAGTSQSGQSIGAGLVVDTSKYLCRIGAVDEEARTVSVDPGVVLDSLNAVLRPHGLFFPVDVATASRATLGGMTGNNSAGARSIRYGMTVEHVRGIDAVLADGSTIHVGARGGPGGPQEVARRLHGAVLEIYERTADELALRVPRVPRHVAGYNLHRMGGEGASLTDLLVGSEGTLAFFTGLELSLEPLPSHRVLGVCHFPALPAALDAVQHLVGLSPSAVELVDGTLLELARAIPAFRRRVEGFVRGRPQALLVVEFSGADRTEVLTALDRLEELLGDVAVSSSLVRAESEAEQADVWAVRKAGLNIVMSMRGDEKPVSFLEDCAVPLHRLTEYHDRLSAIFRDHGTEGTWYAHASVGCLHVRPALNLKSEAGVRAMRSIAEQTLELVRDLGGSHSGEHGDGIVRSEFLEPMLGSRITRAFEEVKRLFDPSGRLNPGKIVDPPRMDDRSLLRYGPHYESSRLPTVLNWNAAGGLEAAVELCNNNGACRTHVGLMCPSYQATRDEAHVTRGRANALRLALSGQLGAQALTSPDMYETMELCIGCKGCRQECPTGVDMARMKIEFLHAYRAEHGLPFRERLFAYLPRYAPMAARLGPLLNLRNRWAGLARLGERVWSITADRPLPVWGGEATRDTRTTGATGATRTTGTTRATGAPGEIGTTGAIGATHAIAVGSGDPRHEPGEGSEGSAGPAGPAVALFVDTFTRYFDPENGAAAGRVLRAAGFRVREAAPARGRPLCCGRTFLSAGLVERAREEARRLVRAVAPLLRDGVQLVGLEPSCVLTLRDELPDLLPGADARLVSQSALLIEELLVRERAAGRADLTLKSLSSSAVRVHGHCHQKAFGAMPPLEEVLGWIPEMDVEVIESGCCGMAGSFGFEAEHAELSRAIGDISLMPAIRKMDPSVRIVANGTSCRSQILDGAERRAEHLVRVLDDALA